MPEEGWSSKSVKGESSIQDRRLIGVVGIAFFIWLVIAGVVYGGILPMPTFGDNAAYYHQYFLDNAAAVRLHTWFSSLFWIVFFLIFAAGLRRELGAASKSSGIWRRLSFNGAVLTVVFGGVGLLFESVAATIAASSSDALILALGRMITLVNAMMLYWGLTVFVGGASIAIFKSGAFSRKLAWLGVSSAVLMILGTMWPFTADDRGVLAMLGLMGLFLLGFWVLFTAISLFRNRSQA